MVTDTPQLDNYRDIAIRAADAARRVILPFFRQPLSVDWKSDRSMVTAADRQAEQAIRDQITSAFPQHGFVGEELGSQDIGRDYVWVVDPIDGTHAFIAGLPTFGTLIALCRDGRPIVGVIDLPALGERWVGVDGQPTQYVDRDGKSKIVSCRPCAGLDDATLFATTPAMFDATQLAKFETVSARVKNTRYGTDCYGYGLMASGYGDLVIEADMKVYDYLALVPVIRGAGGFISDWQGAPLSLVGDGGGRPSAVIAAGDRPAYDAALAMLAS